MRIDSQLLERQAASSGFRADTLETVIRLGDLAADIGRHPLLGRVKAGQRTEP